MYTLDILHGSFLRHVRRYAEMWCTFGTARFCHEFVVAGFSSCSTPQSRQIFTVATSGTHLIRHRFMAKIVRTHDISATIFRSYSFPAKDTQLFNHTLSRISRLRPITSTQVSQRFVQQARVVQSEFQVLLCQRFPELLATRSDFDHLVPSQLSHAETPH